MKKDKSKAKTSPGSKKETVTDDIANLKVDGYSDEEDDETIKTAEHVTDGLEFYRRASQQMQDVADKVERGFSLNK